MRFVQVSRTPVRWLVGAVALAAVATTGVPPRVLDRGTDTTASAERPTADPRGVPPEESGNPDQAAEPVPRHVEGPGALAAASPRERVRALLAQRARAVRERDAAAFMASIDPLAPEGFRRGQREMFHNLAEVPLKTWEYQLAPTPAVPAPAPRSFPVAPQEVRNPKVTLRYALSGVDAVPTTQPLGLLLVRRDDHWYVTGSEPGPGRQPPWRGPWHFGMCLVTVTERGLVLGHDGNRDLTRRVARMLDPAVAAVTQVWGPDWSRRVGVVVPGSRAELRALVGPEFAVDGIAAVAVADEVNVARGRVEGPRIVFNTDTASQLHDTALRVVLRHEITHIAARSETVDGAPMWMLEGFADYVGYQDSGLSPRRIAPDLARQVARDGPPEELPSNADFQQSGSRLDLAYQQSWSLVAFLDSEIGQDRVVELYHRLAGEKASQYTLDSALREVAGMSAAELVEGWRAYLVRTYG